MLLSESVDPSAESVLAVGVVIDPSAITVVEEPRPIGVAASLYALDDDVTRLYVHVGASLLGCDLPLEVQIDLSTDGEALVSVTTGREISISHGCDDRFPLGYFVPLSVPEGLANRIVAVESCTPDRAFCSAAGPAIGADLPRVKAQLVGCVPGFLYHDADPAVFNLDRCSDGRQYDNYLGLLGH